MSGGGVEQTSAQLAQALRLPADLALVFAPIAQLQQPLHPQEQEAVRSAVVKRRREFTAGRTAARLACAQLGGEQAAAATIAVAPDRTPVWPGGVVGSIAHSDASCLVVAGRVERWRSIGGDVETVGRVTRDLWPLLFCAQECEALAVQDAAAATAYFCLKEAFFKLQYGLTRWVPDPRELQVRPAAEGAYRLWLELASGERYEAAGRTAQVGKEMIALCLDPRGA